GWAHYCEKMMLDEGFGGASSSTPNEDDVKRAAKYRMAQADEALLRLCRLCVSIRLHTKNMSLEEATKFFQDNCYYEEKPARQEAMRGTFDPGYLNYTLGKLQILKLRDDYKAQEGDEFSLQKFHNELLNHGMSPIRLLREIMLKDQRSGTTCCSLECADTSALLKAATRRRTPKQARPPCLGEGGSPRNFFAIT